MNNKIATVIKVCFYIGMSFKKRYNSKSNTSSEREYSLMPN